MQFLKAYQDWMSRLNYAIFLLLLISLPYTNRVIRVLWVAWGISFVLEGRLFCKQTLMQGRQTLHSGKQWIFFLLIAVWMLWEALSGLWATDSSRIGTMLGLQVNLLIPLLPLLFGLNKHYSLRQTLSVFVVSCVFSVFVYLMLRFWSWNMYLANDKWYAGEHYSIDFLHLDDMVLNIKHRLHYASLLSAALVAVWMLFPEWIRSHGKAWALTLGIAASVCLLLGILWTGTRMVLIDLLALCCLPALIHLHGIKRWVGAALIACCCMAASWAILRCHPRFEGKPVSELIAYDATAVNEPSFEPRIAIWNAALEQPSDYSLHGLGAGCSTPYLVDKYTEKGWERFRAHRYNTHNQYLMEWLDLGIAGALLFFLMWLCMPFLENDKKARHAACYLLAIIMLNMTTECILTTLDGMMNICAGLIALQVFRQSNKEESLSASEHPVQAND